MKNRTSKLNKTRLSKKLLLIFEDFIRTKEATDFVNSYRKKLGIPENGLKLTEKEARKLSTFDDNLEYFPLLFVPEEIFPLPDGKISSEENKVKILLECDELMTKNGFDNNTLNGLFRFYIYYNKTLDFPLNLFQNNQLEELATIEFLPEIKAYCESENTTIGKYIEPNLKKRQMALFFNPEASLNEIKDFLSTNWHFVESKRDKNISHHYRKRKKPNQAINDFIYEHRELKISEIFTKLSSEMGVVLDDGHIGKILSLQRQKRN